MSDSVLVSKQEKILGPVDYIERGQRMRIKAYVRFDDRCGNGHNTFSITGATWEVYVRGGVECLREAAGGCIHKDVARHFPALAPLIKWHLWSTDGGLHYVANAVYLAGGRDHWGLLEGERRQIVNGRSGLSAWHLVAVDENGAEVELYNLPKSIDSVDAPACPYRLEYRPWCHVGEGKARDLEAARRCAVWFDATDAELCADDLAEKLRARLPALLVEFRAAVESLGFVW